MNNGTTNKSPFGLTLDSSPELYSTTTATSPLSSSSIGIQHINNTIVKLNVGGEKFYTTKETLSLSSFFNTLLNGHCGSSIDSEGFFFIDRDGDLFSQILSYLRTGIFSLPSHISLDKIYCEVDFYRIEPLVKLLATKKQYNNNLPGGGISFINKLPIDNLSLVILNIIVKGNLVIIYYDNNRIDCFVYKGITFHWVKLFTLESSIPIHENLIVNITKNNFNEITQVLLAGSNNKTIVTYKVTVDYAYISITDKIEKIYELKHYSKYLHFIANGFYLGCLSTNGYISILDLGSTDLQSIKFLKVPERITCLAFDYEQSLYFGSSQGKIYEIKQNLRDNFVWSLEEIYKLNDPEFFQNTFGFSSKAMDKYKTLRNRHNNKDNGNTSTSSSTIVQQDQQKQQTADFESEEEHLRIFNTKDINSLITTISFSNIPYSSNSKTIVGIGVADGTVHLASKTNNTRNNDKFLFISKYFMSCNSSTSTDSSISKLQVSGGKEGIFISALSPETSLCKTWYYNYENSIKSPVSKCLSVHSTSSSSGGFDSPYFDILKFKNYQNLHFTSNRNEKLLYSPQSTSGSSSSSSNSTPTTTSPNSSNNSHLLVQTSSSGKKSLGNSKYFTIREKNVHLQKTPSTTSLDDDDDNSNAFGGGGGGSGNINNNNNTSNLNNGVNFETIPKLSYYNQIFVIVNPEFNQLLIYPSSSRNVDIDNPSIEFQSPIFTISLIDTTPIKKIQFLTFGGIEPNINDQAYHLLTIHESNEIYAWNLNDINSKF